MSTKRSKARRLAGLRVTTPKLPSGRRVAFYSSGSGRTSARCVHPRGHRRRAGRHGLRWFGSPISPSPLMLRRRCGRSSCRRGAAPWDRSLGSRGVIYSAMRESRAPGQETVEFDLFTDADDVAAIFALEESGMPLTVQVEDVWMPRAWFEDEAAARRRLPGGTGGLPGCVSVHGGDHRPGRSDGARHEWASDQLAARNRGRDAMVAGSDRRQPAGLPGQGGQAEVEDDG